MSLTTKGKMSLSEQILELQLKNPEKFDDYASNHLLHQARIRYKKRLITIIDHTMMEEVLEKCIEKAKLYDLGDQFIEQLKLRL